MAAQYGSLVGISTSGKGIYKDLYFDDTAGNRVNFDDGSGAGTATPNEHRPAESFIITGICLAAATAQTKSQVNINDNPTGVMIRNSLHLASVTNRPALRIPVPAGQKLTIIQRA